MGMKMIGPTTRVCPDKFCTCNEAKSKGRRAQNRTAKRRERVEWKRAARVEMENR